jgi:hypothetical protein
MEDRQPPVEADWYTGVLRIEHGELLRYFHGGNLSVFDRDEYMVVIDGGVVSRFEVTNDPDALNVPLFSRLKKLDQEAPADASRGEHPWLDTLGLEAKMRRKKTAHGTIRLRGLFLGDQVYLPGNGLEGESRIRLETHVDAILPELGVWVEAEVTLTELWHGKLAQFRLLRAGEFLDRRGLIPVPKLLDT